MHYVYYSIAGGYILWRRWRKACFFSSLPSFTLMHSLCAPLREILSPQSPATLNRTLLRAPSVDDEKPFSHDIT